MMTPDLAMRIVDGARAGSLVVTRTEYTIIGATVAPGAVVIIDGNPRPIHAIPVHILPDSLDGLGIVDPNRTDPR